MAPSMLLRPLILPDPEWRKLAARKPFKHPLYILGALLIAAAFCSFVITFSYTTLCYHQVPTGYLTYCSLSLYYASQNGGNIGASIESAAKRWRNVARYEDICVCEDPKGPDFYEEQETGSPAESTDLATVLLPAYSKNIPLNNISNELFLHHAFFQHSELTHYSPINYSHHKPTLTILGIASASRFCGNESDSYLDQLLANRPHLLCAFESHHGGELRTSASIECLPEGHGKPFTSVMIHCRVPVRAAGHHLAEVKLIQRDVHTHRSKVSGPIEVIRAARHRDHHGSNDFDITVCVRPLFGTINVMNLLEFIGFYRTNGVSNIALYYYDFTDRLSPSETANRTANFLQFISTLPGVRLHRFVLPKAVETDIHAGAQISTVHDCLLRYPDSVQIHVDIDEFIFVGTNHQTTTIRQWIESQRNAPVSYVALTVANVLHCHEFNLKHSKYYEFQLGKCTSDEVNLDADSRDQCATRVNRLKNQFYQSLNNDSVRRALIVPNNRYCQQTVWEHDVRSKNVILHPRLVKHAGIHFVWRFAEEEEEEEVLDSGLFSGLKRQLAKVMLGSAGNGSTTRDNRYYTYRKVDPAEAILRHYRWCCQMRQTYFFNLLSFYSVEDSVISAAVPSHQSGRTNQSSGPIKSSLPWAKEQSSATTVVSQVEQFVLVYFKKYLNKILN